MEAAHPCLPEENGPSGPGGRVVMIAIDNSVQAEEAFDWYADNLHVSSNTVNLVHVIEPPDVPTNFSAMGRTRYDELIREEQEKAKVLEMKYQIKMKSKGMAGIARCIFSSRAGETLVAEADHEKASMLVIGMRGQGKIRRTILGSVADFVIHHAHCPVIICRPQAEIEKEKSRSRHSSGRSAGRSRHASKEGGLK